MGVPISRGCKLCLEVYGDPGGCVTVKPLDENMQNHTFKCFTGSFNNLCGVKEVIYILMPDFDYLVHINGPVQFSSITLIGYFRDGQYFPLEREDKNAKF